MVAPWDPTFALHRDWDLSPSRSLQLVCYPLVAPLKFHLVGTAGTAGSAHVSIRFPPSALARYSALSARSSTSPPLPFRGSYSATPIEAVTAPSA